MSAQFDFLAGLDISSLSSVTQAQLMQMINQLAPLTNIGGVIFQTGTSLAATIPEGTGGSPDVTNNPRFERYIWLNTYNAAAAAPTPYYYDASSGDWSSNAVAPLSITNAEIAAAAAIVVTKLAAGTARYLVRTNGAGTSVEYVAPASIFNNGELPVASIVPAGGNGYLKTVSGAAAWVVDATERAAIQAAITSLAVSQLAAGSNGNVLTTLAGVPTWAAPATAFPSGSNLPLGALAQGGAVANDALVWNGSTWVPSTQALRTISTAVVSTTGVVSTTDAAGGNITGTIANLTHRIAHGLGAIPKSVQLNLVCTVADTGVDALFALNTELPIQSIMSAAANNNCIYSILLTNTYIYVALRTTTVHVVNMTSGGLTSLALTNTSWKVKAYAWL